MPTRTTDYLISGDAAPYRGPGRTAVLRLVGIGIDLVEDLAGLVLVSGLLLLVSLLITG